MGFSFNRAGGSGGGGGKVKRDPFVLQNSNFGPITTLPSSPTQWVTSNIGYTYGLMNGPYYTRGDTISLSFSANQWIDMAAIGGGDYGTPTNFIINGSSFTPPRVIGGVAGQPFWFDIQTYSPTITLYGNNSPFFNLLVPNEFVDSEHNIIWPPELKGKPAYYIGGT